MSSSEPERWSGRLRRIMGALDREPVAAEVTIPGFDLREKVGEGATAVVYRARDRQLDRTVAIKILKETVTLHASLHQRFRREAQAIARLSHPCIVTLHSVGEVEDRPYLVMEFVNGCPLNQILKGRSQDRGAILSLLEQVARAVHVAHKQGIVHRDLKPGNILVEKTGKPKVVDFGLAFLVESETVLTKTGSSIGTPSYMPPEQIQGRLAEIGPRSDVFAMGAILYEVLVGEPPHAGITTFDVYEKILREPPVPVRARNPSIPRDLESIAMHALEKDPPNRYPTLEEFAEDLRRHLAGEPVKARPVSMATRLWRRMRRRKVLVPVAAALTLTAIGIGGWILADHLRRAGAIRTAWTAAVTAEREGRPDNAREAYRRVLDLDDRHPGAKEGFERTDRTVRAQIARGRAVDEGLKLIEQAQRPLDRADRLLYSATSTFDNVVAEVEPAVKRLEEAAEKVPDLAIPHHHLGRAWFLLGDLARAESSWRRAIELNPALGPAHYQLGRLLLVRAFHTPIGTNERERAVTLHSMEEAGRHFEEAMKSGSGFDDELAREFAAAAMDHAKGNVVAVRQRATGILDRYKNREGVEDFHWLLGTLEDGDRKIEAYERALQVCPKHLFTLSAKGAQLIQQGRWEEATKSLDEEIRLFPRFAIPYVDRSIARRNLGNLPGALEDLDEALRLDPENPSAYTNRGVIKAELGDRDGAIEDFDHAIARAPEDDETWYNRGVARWQMGEREDAIADLTEAIRLNPGNAEALARRGDGRIQMGEIEAGRTDLTRAMELPAPDEFTRQRIAALARKHAIPFDE